MAQSWGRKIVLIEPFSSNDPCSSNYRGPKAESEKCVYACATAMRKVKGQIIAYFSLHSFLQLFLIPNSYTFHLPPSFNDNVSSWTVFVKYETTFIWSADCHISIKCEAIRAQVLLYSGNSYKYADQIKFIYAISVTQCNNYIPETFKFGVFPVPHFLFLNWTQTLARNSIQIFKYRKVRNIVFKNIAFLKRYCF